MNDAAKEMLDTLRKDEQAIAGEIGKLRQSLEAMEANLHRTQGAIFVLEKLTTPADPNTVEHHNV